MRVDDYQKWTRSTAVYPRETAISYLGLGLAGEAGEAVNKIKKTIRDKDTPLQSDYLADELGDVAWYLARLADELGYSLSFILARNQGKLTSRLRRGNIGGSGDQR